MKYVNGFIALLGLAAAPLLLWRLAVQTTQGREAAALAGTALPLIAYVLLAIGGLAALRSRKSIETKYIVAVLVTVVLGLLVT